MIYNNSYHIKIHAVYSLIVFFLFLSGVSSCQTTDNKNIPVGFRFGILSGGNYGNLNYSSANIRNTYQNTGALKMVTGISLEYFTKSNVSLKTSVSLWDKGGELYGNDIYYKFNPKFIDFDLQAVYNFPVIDYLIPCIIIGGVVNVAQGGNIELGTQSLKITEGNIQTVNTGLKTAIGLKVFIRKDRTGLMVMPSIGYEKGLSNTYSKYELSGEAKAINASSYLIEGKRSLSGIYFLLELSVSIRGLSRRPFKFFPELPFYKHYKR